MEKELDSPATEDDGIKNVIDSFWSVIDLLQQRREALRFHRELIGRSLKSSSEVFWLVEQSYNKAVIAEMKKWIAKYNDDGTRKEEKA